MVVEIKKASLEDSEAIVALLEGFYPNVANHWRKLFKPRDWKVEGDFPGLIVVDNTKIVGFLGLIFSEHLHPASQETFKICNLTTWYIDPNYRQYTMALLMQMLRLPGVTWTNLTSTPLVYPLFKKLGFQDLENTQTLILPIPYIGRNKSSIEIILSPKPEQLSNEEQKIQKKHRSLCCQEILIKQKEKHCYCLAVITRYKKVPLAKIYYMSNVSLLNELLPAIRWQLCLKLRVAYLLIEGDILQNKKYLGAFKKKLTPPRLFKSDTLTRETTPLLCSELFILGI